MQNLRNGRLERPEGAVLGWAPFLSQGACLYSGLITYYLHAGCSRNRACVDIYGARIRPLNLFGIGARHVAATLFPGSLNSKDVLDRHSLYGLYQRFLPHEHVQRWSTELSEPAGTLNLTHYFNLSAGPFAMWKSLRFCFDCVHDAATEGRLPEWKVIHQLPFLNCCPIHGRRLISRCADCGHIYDQGTDFRLPGQQCIKCGNKPKAKSASANAPIRERAMATLCAEVFENRLNVVNPFRWACLIRHINEQAGGSKFSSEMIVRRLKKSWRVGKIEEIFADRGILVTESDVEQEMAQMMVCRPYLRILLLETLLNIWGNECRDLERQTLTNDEGLAELYRQALCNGIPLGVIDRVVDGQPIHKVAKAASGMKFQRLRDFLSSLPGHPQMYVGDRRLDAVDVTRFRSKFPLTDPVATYRRKMIEIVRDHPNSSRSAIRSMASPMANWLYQNDRQGFEEILPAAKSKKSSGRRFLTRSARRSFHRDRVSKAKLSHPDWGRVDIFRNEQKSADWLFRRDRAWFNENFPAERFEIPTLDRSGGPLSDNDKTKRWLAYVKQIIRLNPQISRSEVTSIAPVAVRWLRAHALVRLERVLPRPLKRRRAVRIKAGAAA